MSHKWKVLNKENYKTELAECIHCKIRRRKTFEHGNWRVWYYTLMSVMRRIAPVCINQPKKVNQV